MEDRLERLRQRTSMMKINKDPSVPIASQMS